MSAEPQDLALAAQALNDYVINDYEHDERRLVDAALARDLIEMDTVVIELDQWPAARDFIARVLREHDLVPKATTIHVVTSLDDDDQIQFAWFREKADAEHHLSMASTPSTLWEHSTDFDSERQAYEISSEIDAISRKGHR